MGRVVMESEWLHVEVEPSLGAGIADFSLRKRDGTLTPLMRRAPERVGWFNHLACYFLAPWSNRITAGRFVHRGREHHVSPDWPDGTAIHGLVKDKAWRIVERTPVSAILEFDSAEAGVEYPWQFETVARYELFESALGVRLTLRHAAGGKGVMPAGIGFHPFFPRALTSGDDAEVFYRARGRYPAEGMIPTGAAAADAATQHLADGGCLGNLALDDVFLGSADGATITWPRSGVRVRYECSAELGHAVVYTGPEGADRPPFFCFEPVSMVNDGFNLAARGWSDTGVVELAPGEAMTVDWTLRVERL